MMRPSSGRSDGGYILPSTQLWSGADSPITKSSPGSAKAEWVSSTRRDTSQDRAAAIKILSRAGTATAEQRQRFTQEAKAASALNHPGIITIYDIASDQDVDFIAMEYVQGRTLEQLIDRKALTLKTALDYAVQAAQALAKAHAAGIIHRDLNQPTSWSPTTGW